MNSHSLIMSKGYTYIQEPSNVYEVFINDFVLNQTQNIIDQVAKYTICNKQFVYDIMEGIRLQYRAGYCYYFAKMLEAAFQDGYVAWAAPFNHFVYVTNDRIAYDIEGQYEGEAFYFIPVDAYFNMNGYNLSTQEYTSEELATIIDAFCADNKIQVDERIFNYF